jgi:anthranilate phosphoribosyltransferase
LTDAPAAGSVEIGLSVGMPGFETPFPSAGETLSGLGRILQGEENSMHPAVRAVVICSAVMLTIAGAVRSIHWAKRASTGAQFVASAMMLVLGWAAPIVQQPQQGVEEAREDMDKEDGESGDPPV